MAGEGDAERLVVLLEARVSDFEKNLAKASGTATKNFGQMRRSSQSATMQMEADVVRSTTRINQALATTSTKIGVFGKSFAAGALAPIAGLLTLTAVINGTRKALSEFDEIGKSAKAAGLRASSFQELAYAAKLGGIETATFAKAMETLNKNAGLAAEGKGKLVSQLQALNPELLKNIQAATTQEERIRMVANALNKETDSAKKAAIAAVLFGEAGARMVGVLDGGSKPLDAMAKKARDLGIVVDDELIARAEKLGDEWDAAAMVINVRLQSALVGLAPTIVWLTGLVADMAGELTDVADLLYEAQHNPGDFVKYALLGGKKPADRRLEDLKSSIWNEIEAAKGSQYTGMAGALMGTGSSNDVGAGPSARDLAKWFGVKLSTTTAPPVVPALPDIPGDGAGGKPTRNKEAEAALKQAAAVKELISDLTFEQSLIGKSDTERRVAIELRKAGAAATDDEQKQIVALVASMEAENASIARLKEQMEEAKGLAKEFASSLIGDLVNGKNATEALANAFGNLGKKLIDMALDQAINALFSNLMGAAFGTIAGGAAIPSGGFIPGLTGPKLFADGTANTGGRVGEPRGIVHGQEAVIPLPSGGKVPVQIQGGAMPTSGDAIAINITNHMQVMPGATTADGAAFARGVTEALKRQLPDAIDRYNRNPYRRGN
jgi:hypothetical protein